MTDYLNPHRVYIDAQAAPDLNAEVKRNAERNNEVSKYLEQDLIPQYDAKASYHGKAKVTTIAGHKVLVSNGTNVASIITDRQGREQAYIFDPDMNGTALRHTKEFLRQNGFKADTKMQMLKDYYRKG